MQNEAPTNKKMRMCDGYDWTDATGSCESEIAAVLASAYDEMERSSLAFAEKIKAVAESPIVKRIPVERGGMGCWTWKEDFLLVVKMAVSVVGYDMPHPRSKGACNTRWMRLNKGGPLRSNGKPWTEEEDQTILRCGVVHLPGRSFAAVGKRQTYLTRRV